MLFFNVSKAYVNFSTNSKMATIINYFIRLHYAFFREMPSDYHVILSKHIFFLEFSNNLYQCRCKLLFFPKPTSKIIYNDILDWQQMTSGLTFCQIPKLLLFLNLIIFQVTVNNLIIYYVHKKNNWNELIVRNCAVTLRNN